MTEYEKQTIRKALVDAIGVCAGRGGRATAELAKERCEHALAIIDRLETETGENPPDQ